MFSLMRNYHKKFTSLNNLVPQTENKKVLKQEVLNNAGDIYNKLYYIYKNKYNKKINSLDTKNRTKLDYKKLRLSGDYEYLSEEEEKTIIDLNAFKEWIIKKEANINSELFKTYFNYQMPSALFNDLKHNLKDKPLKNIVLVHIIESGLIDFKKKLKRCLKKK